MQSFENAKTLSRKRRKGWGCAVCGSSVAPGKLRALWALLPFFSTLRHGGRREKTGCSVVVFVWWLELPYALGGSIETQSR